jgi:hypothetical protein
MELTNMTLQCRPMLQSANHFIKLKRAKLRIWLDGFMTPFAGAEGQTGTINEGPVVQARVRIATQTDAVICESFHCSCTSLQHRVVVPCFNVV